MAGFWARVGGGELQNVTSPWGSNPGFTARSCHRLLINSPAPTTRTTARAISLVTSAPRRRCRPRPVPAPAVPCFSESVRSGRAALRAGKSPTATAVMTVTPSAKARTQPSTRNASSRGSTPGAARHAVEIRLRLLRRDSRLETADDAAVGMEAPLGEGPVGRGHRRNRHVQLLGRPRWVRHVVRKHTHDGEHSGGKRQRLAEDGLVSPEAVLPQRVRQDRYMGTRALLIGREQPSEKRALAEGRKEAGRHGGHQEVLDTLGAGEPLPSATHVGEASERRGLGLPIEEGGVRWRPECPLTTLLGQHEQPILLR